MALAAVAPLFQQSRLQARQELGADRGGNNDFRIRRPRTLASASSNTFAGELACLSQRGTLQLHPAATSPMRRRPVPAAVAPRPRSERECPGRQRALSGRGRAPVYQARECLIQPVHQVAHGLAGDLERTDHNPIGFRRSRGISPARSSEDLRLPEAPEMTSAVSP